MEKKDKLMMMYNLTSFSHVLEMARRKDLSDQKFLDFLLLLLQNCNQYFKELIDEKDL